MSDQLFRVWDTMRDCWAEPEVLALNEPWAEDLNHCDMEGFLIGESGELMLADETGRHVFCPPKRFTVFFNLQ